MAKTPVRRILNSQSISPITVGEKRVSFMCLAKVFHSDVRKISSVDTWMRFGTFLQIILKSCVLESLISLRR